MAIFEEAGGGRKDCLIYKDRKICNLLTLLLIIFPENLKHGLFISLTFFFPERTPHIEVKNICIFRKIP